MRNPPWDSVERELALDLYLRRGNVDKGDPEVAWLSSFMNERARSSGLEVGDNFRNPAGVALKLANFAALDPSHPGKGMERYSQGDAATWTEFSGDSDLLAARVDQILSGGDSDRPFSGSADLLPLESDDTFEYTVTINHAVRQARRSEAVLVKRFGRFLSDRGNRVGARHHEVDSGVLRIDLVDETDQRIWEAKHEVGRNAVRLAVGQLADYRRFHPATFRTGVLLSRRPAEDLIDLCATVDAAVAWPADAAGFDVQLPA